MSVFVSVFLAVHRILSKIPNRELGGLGVGVLRQCALGGLMLSILVVLAEACELARREVEFPFQP